jgi:hypothetical protein
MFLTQKRFPFGVILSNFFANFCETKKLKNKKGISKGGKKHSLENLLPKASLLIGAALLEAALPEFARTS